MPKRVTFYRKIIFTERNFNYDSQKEITAHFKIKGKSFSTPGMHILTRETGRGENYGAKRSEDRLAPMVKLAKKILLKKIRRNITCYRKAAKTNLIVYKRSKGRGTTVERKFLRKAALQTNKEQPQK